MAYSTTLAPPLFALFDDRVVWVQRARRVARALVAFSIGLGLFLAACLAGICLLGGPLLSSDAHVLSLVKSVLPQSMVCEALCSLTLALDGIAVGSGRSHGLHGF